MQTFLSTTYSRTPFAAALAAVLLGAGTVTGAVIAAGDGTGAPSGQGAATVAGGSYAAWHRADVVRRPGGHAYRLHPLVRPFASGMPAEEEGTVPRVLPVRTSWALTRTGDTA
ncbi:hypothetical protein [Streptomyces marianii]|uniref:Uncharacterized protein n=1 Tax=Streptomyces marianii TaxID=1817406 RepID=A0A5R9E654_9ACTN|nr:hypothetical protein [Streptomyces marianii]TLQ44515.1 hypothetical protein FEF34_16520 [Streptomyces marianii]